MLKLPLPLFAIWATFSILKSVKKMFSGILSLGKWSHMWPIQMWEPLHLLFYGPNYSVTKINSAGSTRPFSKTDQQDVSKNLLCLYRSSFTKNLWHQSASLIAICPTALPIIHCGIDPQREWESLEKIGLFCFLVYFCSYCILPYSSQFYCNVEKRYEV